MIRTTNVPAKAAFVTACALGTFALGTLFPVQAAYADEIYEIQSQYGFVDSAFTIADQRTTYGELISISKGWSWKSSYNGSSLPHLVYDGGYYNGTNPLDATVLYRRIGTVNGKWVDARVRYSDVGRWSEPYWKYSTSAIELKEFWAGCTYFCCGSLNLTYSLYWADTTEKVPMNDAWMTFGSLNMDEGVRYNASGTIQATVLRQNNLRQVSNGYWKGISNDFQDYLGGGTFARNAVSFRIKSSDVSATMISTSGAMWMFPLFTPLTNVKPPAPAKTCVVLD